MKADYGSFRDPSGQVFLHDGGVYRSIFSKGIDSYLRARDSGVYRELTEAGLIIFHEEVNAGDWAPEGTVICLKHPRIPMVSYPWEWPFSLLKDAALLHIDIMNYLIPKGFWLRDASAFNIQYDGKRLRHIDTLSVGPRIPESPWVAYRQFCEQFLGPLTLAAYGDIRLCHLWRNYIDGFPLDLVVKMLPICRRYSPGLFMHLKLHARAQRESDKKDNLVTETNTKRIRVSDTGLTGILNSLRKTVSGLRWKPRSDLWESYGDIRTYTAEDVNRKSEFVAKVVSRLKPKFVWDLGANRGEFSLIAAANGAFVVSIDGDPACSEALYQKVSNDSSLNGILPLTMDLSNPSPALGWDGRERKSLWERGPTDLVMALALVHHLVLSSCVPLELIARWLSTLGTNLLIEFIPREDTMVKKLLKNRKDEHLPYNVDLFKKSFGELFDLQDKIVLDNKRSLFLYRRSTVRG